MSAWNTFGTRAEFLQQLTPENTRIKDVQEQISDALATKQKLESNFPRLNHEKAAHSFAIPEKPGSKPEFDLASEMIHIAALQAKLKALIEQVDTLRTESANLEARRGKHPGIVAQEGFGGSKLSSLRSQPRTITHK